MTVSTITGLKYHGVRYAKNCLPNDGYMGSSCSKSKIAIEFRENMKIRKDTFIKEIVQEYGENEKLAIEDEMKANRIYMNDCNWINEHCGGGFSEESLKRGRENSNKTLKTKCRGFYDPNIRILGMLAAKKKKVGACFDKVVNTKHLNRLKELGLGFFNKETRSKAGKLGGKIQGPKNKNRIWICNNIKSKMVFSIELNYYLSVGWKLGRGKLKLNCIRGIKYG